MALDSPPIGTPVSNQTGNNPRWAGWFTVIYDLLVTLKSRYDKTIYGVGTPEGVVAAEMGTVYVNTLGGTSRTLWVKEIGSGVNGWVAK